MRSLVVVLATLPLLLGTLVTGAAAQAAAPPATTEAAEPTDADVLARLARDQPCDVAWGARLAGQRGLDQATPRLLAILEGRTPIVCADEGQERHLRNHIVDALVRLDARLPVGSPAIEALGPGSAAAMIFYSRDPRAHGSALVRLFAEASGKDMRVERVAAGNLLATTPSPGFVAELLRRLPLSLCIRVRDAGTADRGRGGRRSMSFGRGSGIARVPAGFPPLVYYELSFTRREGSGADCIDVAHGTESVYAVRVEVEDGRIHCSPSRSRRAEALCDAWLLSVLPDAPDAPDGTQLERHRSVLLEWQDEPTYVRAATAARDDLLTGWYALVRRCFDARHLSRDEALAAKPRLSLTVEDDRAQKTVSIPRLPESGVTLDLPEDAR